MMGQSMECWSTTSVHLVTVSVVEWIMIVVDVIVSTIMMMMIASVSVIGKVTSFMCNHIVQVIAITHPHTMPRSRVYDRVFTNQMQSKWVCYKYVSGLKIPIACV